MYFWEESTHIDTQRHRGSQSISPCLSTGTIGVHAKSISSTGVSSSLLFNLIKDSVGRTLLCSGVLCCAVLCCVAHYTVVQCLVSTRMCSLYLIINLVIRHKRIYLCNTCVQCFAQYFESIYIRVYVIYRNVECIYCFVVALKGMPLEEGTKCYMCICMLNR